MESSSIENFANSVSLHDVNKSDKEAVKSVFRAIGKFERPLPQLKVDVKNVGDHYNISILGFKRNIDYIRWVKIFHDKKGRRSAHGQQEIPEYVRHCISSSANPNAGLVVLRCRMEGFQSLQSKASFNNNDGGSGGRKNKKSGVAQNLVLSDDIKLDTVRAHDAEYVRKILQDVLGFNPKTPKVNVKCSELDSCYNINIKNYDQEIDLIRWVNLFHGRQRMTHREFCMSSGQFPKSGSLVLQVSKHDFEKEPRAASKRRRNLKPSGK